MTKEKANPPQRRTWRFYLGYPIFLLVILLIAGEVTVRVMGYGAWSQAEQSFEVSPGDSFFRADSLLGYAGRPGTFDIVLNQQLKFQVQHNAEGYRRTAAADTALRPEIWLLGCSFTHGFGVDDPATYPWQLQEAAPGHTVRNYAMSGYGTLQSLLQMQELLRTRARPALIILAYGAFHDQRNTSNRYWRKVLSGSPITDGLRYPHLRYNAQDSLEMGYSRLEYSPFPLMRWSAFSHYLEDIYNRSEDQQLRSQDVTRHLIADMAAQANAQQIPFLLAGIFQHPETSKMLNEFANEGFAGQKGTVVDISQDQDDPDLRILPEDGHPNPQSHRLMAEALITYLQSKQFLPAPEEE